MIVVAQILSFICWFWSIIFQIHRYYSIVIVTQKYCTLIPPTLGFGGKAPKNFFLGCVLANSFSDRWYWVNRSIFPWYFPYKRKHCNTTVYGIVLYWKRDRESMKRKCNGFAVRCIPSSFQNVIKGLANLFVDIAHRLGEPRYICVSL